MNKLLTLCLLIVGLINFLPVVGLLGSSHLESTYNIQLLSNDLIILMRHRALLFGLLGGFILYSAFFPQFQTASMIMAGISMIGFVVLALMVGSDNPAIAKVLKVDYVGIFLLFIAVILKYADNKNKSKPMSKG